MIQELNGFKIVRYTEKKRNNQYVIAECKHCKKEWETALYTLKTKKSCGCNSWKQLKPLPEYINGFRTIKCHGYNHDKGYRWATVECKVCKNEYEVDPNKLQYRDHCGCMKKGVIASKFAKSHPQLTMTIKHMIGRCNNPNNQDYYNYGARGITICEEWIADRNSFFSWSTENGFEEGRNLSIDRIDSTKGYSPDNCRWVDAVVQGRNTRRNVLNMIKVREIRSKYKEDSTLTTLSLAKEYNVSKGTIWLVLHNKIWKE